MINLTEEDIKQARDLIAHGTPEAVLYRLLIKPIEASTGLEASEESKFQTLGKLGFEAKTAEQASRESKGTHHGILVHVGPGAFKGDIEKFAMKPPREGDVVIFDRYTGCEIELPPGSGNKFRFANDEALLGRMVKKEVSENV